MSTRLLPALAAALLIVRLPSLVQPMGPDQGLYAYVGERILHGDLAYRDAWDQKPPGIHYVYAGLRAISARDAVIPAADLAAAAIAAALIWIIGGRIAGPAAGGLSAVLFLLLSDPALGRYGGVRVRAQGETFIAVAVAGAVALVLRQRSERRAPAVFAAGLLIGAAFAIKYNAGLYGAVALLALSLDRRPSWREAALLAGGAVVIPAVLFAIFWRGHALDDLYHATITYNLHYSGQTYAGPFDMLRYLAVFPIEHARVDALWFAGGLGCLALLLLAVRQPAALLPVAWVAAACVSIAVNGSRNLPQYFLQAAPALALAAGCAAVLGLPRLPRLARWAVVAVVAIGIWRAGDDPFPKLVRSTWQDTLYAAGRVDRRVHLARFGGREVDKYSALDNIDLGALFASRTSADDTVYVFGFSPGAYVYAGRRSASRFFWSRPVILDFNRENAAYGVGGLVNDLQRAHPAVIALQMHDWSPDVQDSGPFFLSQPRLADWLRAGYHEVPGIAGFQIWERNGR